MSRQTGLALGLYEREVRFYSEVAPRLGGPIAECFHTSYDPETGIFALLIDDAAPAVVGDEIRGATAEEARLALTELGRLHAPVIGSETFADADWLNRDAPLNQELIAQLYAGFADRYGEAITPEQRLVCQRLVDSFDAYLAGEAAPERIRGLVHGDYRLDNMLFGRSGSRRDLTVVDWQTVGWGPAMTDVSYFIGCALPVEDRRTHYEDLLRAYHEGLGPDSPVTLEDVREGVRHQSFCGGDDGGGLGDARRTHRARRRDVPDDAGTPQQPCAGHRCARHPARGCGSRRWFPTRSTRARTNRATSRCGTRVGTGTSPIPSRGSAAGSGSDWCPTRRSPGSTRWCADRTCLPWRCSTSRRRCPQDPATVTGDGMELRHSATIPLQSYRVEVGGAAQAYDDPVGAAERRGRPSGPARDGPDVDNDGHPVRLPDHHPLRDPLHRHRNHHRRRPHLSDRGGRRAARPLPRCARLVEHGLGVECPASRRRDPPARGGLRIPGLCPRSASATSSARGSRLSRRRR